MPKISTYPANSSPDDSFEFIGTDPANHTEGPSGTTQVVTLANLATAAAALSNPMTTQGDLIVGGTSGAPQRLGAGTSGYVLTAHGAGTLPTWAAGGGGGGGGVTGWKNLVSDYGADPTGAASSSAAIASMCTAAVAAQPASFGCMVPPGKYLVTASQQLPYNLIFQGSGGVGGDVSNQFTGTWFSVASSFSGSYVFGFSDNSDHTSANGCIASNFGIDGVSHTSSAVSGILITGPALTTLQNIYISQMSGWGVNTAIDSAASEIGAYGQLWTNLTSDSCGVVAGGGFNLQWCEDSIFVNLYSIGNGNGDGFTITACDNSKFTSSNSEWNNNHGWHITGDWQYATGGCSFSNISTDANSNDGMHIDATWTTGGGVGTGPGMVLVSGLFCRRDGKIASPGSGTYAGLSIGATTLPVLITGFEQQTGIGDGGAGTMSPNFGIYFSQTSYSAPIIIGPGIAWGYTAALRTTSTSNSWPTGVVRSNVVGVTGNNYAPTYGSVLT